MLKRLSRFFRGLSQPSQTETARAALHAEIDQYRRERSELLARIGEEVVVWERAGGEAERLLTEELRLDLRRLGELEEAIAAALPLLQTDESGLTADDYSRRGSMLADADGYPEVIKAAPAPPTGSISPEPAH